MRRRDFQNAGGQGHRGPECPNRGQACAGIVAVEPSGGAAGFRGDQAKEGGSMGDGFIPGDGNISGQGFVSARKQPGQDSTSGQTSKPKL